MLQVIRALARDDDDYACEAMELFDELIESEVSIIVPFLPSVITFLLDVRMYVCTMYILYVCMYMHVLCYHLQHIYAVMCRL